MISGHPQQESNAKIRVFVRVRPPNRREQTAACRKVINILDRNSLIFDPEEVEDPFYFRGSVQKGRDLNKKVNKNAMFRFDQVFDERATNDEVFEATTQGVVASLFEGYNCSVFAYGTTGAGKTYTMLGTAEQPGIAYLTIMEILKHVQNSKNSNVKVSLGASYVEVYNELVRDLLHPDAKNLQLLDQGSGLVRISGLVIETIESSDQLLHLLTTGNQNRSQSPTDSNSESSRSHAIFQVHVQMRNCASVKFAKLSMIDLAGSERAASCGVRNVRFQEGTNINKSLLALGNCINALADGKKHIPYRDSKLTRILKDSLGGNCRTIMIANVSPASLCYEDTYKTLNYATRAMCIKSKLVKNVISESNSVVYLKKVIEGLQLKINLLESEKKESASQVRSAVNTGPVWSKINEWIDRISLVMDEKKRNHRDTLALLSQYRLTQWRLNHKEVAFALQNPVTDQLSKDRIEVAINQLRGRSHSISRSLEDIKLTRQMIHVKERNLIDEIKAQGEMGKFLLDNVLEKFNQQVKLQEQEMYLQHQATIIKLQAKQDENHTLILNSMVPTFTEFYNLLRVHGHLTNNLAARYQESMKHLDGLKAVTWLYNEDDDFISENNQWLRLSLPTLPQTDKANEPSANDFEYPLKDRTNETTKLEFPSARLLGSFSKSKTFVKATLKNKENSLSRYPILGTPGKYPKRRTGLKIKGTPAKTTLRSHPYAQSSMSSSKHQGIRMNKLAIARLTRN